MSGRVTVHQGVSVEDRERLERIAEDQFDDREGLEVVIDDVSDRLEMGLQLFETLFPHLSAGGTYVVQRWSLDHFVFEGYLAALDPADRGRVGEMRAEGAAETLARKGHVLEALLPILVRALRARSDIVAGVEVSQQSIAVTRGPAPIETPFKLSDIAHGAGDQRDTRS
jgi:hypothetical protein